MSPKLTLQLKQGEVVPGFREGDPADRYYVLRANPSPNPNQSPSPSPNPSPNPNPNPP